MDSLTIAVIAIAVVQALTILLTIVRAREIKKLREQLDQQRLHIVDLRAWLAGWNAAQRAKIKSEREPIANSKKAPEPAITPKVTEIDSAEPRRMKAAPAEPEPTITLDTTYQRPTEDEIREAIGDADKARTIVAVLRGTPPQKIG
jgi:hypothetical protein